jgi:hypothetical protein
MNYVKKQVAGFYRDIDIQPGQLNEDDIQKKERELEGTTRGRDEDVFNILECHINLDLEGFEDVGPDGEPTGIKLPYIVTLEENSREVFIYKKETMK